MVSMKKALAKILAWINARPKIQVVTTTYTYDGNVYGEADCPAVTGYKCMGIIGYEARGASTATENAFDMRVAFSSQKYYISNSQGLGSSYQVVLYLLYIHESLLA